jgi:hypothetical protein
VAATLHRDGMGGCAGVGGGQVAALFGRNGCRGEVRPGGGVALRTDARLVRGADDERGEGEPSRAAADRGVPKHERVAASRSFWEGQADPTRGSFKQARTRGFIMLDVSVENSWQVVFHEYGHQLIHGNVADEVDAWFDEGFAEYFSSIEVDVKQARVGKIPAQTYQTWGYTGLMKAGDLIRVQENSSVYNESGDHRTAFYTTSSLVVHYIYDNQLIPKVGEYFAHVREGGKQPEEAFQQAFGMSTVQFDKVLRQYASSGQYKYYTWPRRRD